MVFSNFASEGYSCHRENFLVEVVYLFQLASDEFSNWVEVYAFLFLRGRISGGDPRGLPQKLPANPQDSKVRVGKRGSDPGHFHRLASPRTRVPPSTGASRRHAAKPPGLRGVLRSVGRDARAHSARFCVLEAGGLLESADSKRRVRGTRVSSVAQSSQGKPEEADRLLPRTGPPAHARDSGRCREVPAIPGQGPSGRRVRRHFPALELFLQRRPQRVQALDRLEFVRREPNPRRR